MLPIRDHNPSGRTPFVTYVLIAANIAVFVLVLLPAADPWALNRIYMGYAIVPQELSQGIAFETLFTSMFLHAGWAHLGGNMLFLWIYGDNMEDEMGHLPFLVFYFAAGAAAGLVHVIAAPYSDVPTVGASGAIAGVMGGYLLMFPKARIDILLILIVYFRIFPIPAWIVLMVWFGMQFVGGIGSDPDAGGVAYWAHAGGFVAGLLLTVPLWLRKGGPGFWARTDYHPPHPEARYRLVESSIPKTGRRRR